MVKLSHLRSRACSDVVRLERPDLEAQRNELIVNINKAKNELKVLYRPSLTCVDIGQRIVHLFSHLRYSIFFVEH